MSAEKSGLLHDRAVAAVAAAIGEPVTVLPCEQSMARGPRGSRHKAVPDDWLVQASHNEIELAGREHGQQFLSALLLQADRIWGCKARSRISTPIAATGSDKVLSLTSLERPGPKRSLLEKLAPRVALACLFLQRE
jgi:hypothetical protein